MYIRCGCIGGKGIYIDAVEQYNKALEMDPDNYDIMLKIFDSYKNLNDEKGLEEIYERAKMPIRKMKAYT